MPPLVPGANAPGYTMPPLPGLKKVAADLSTRKEPLIPGWSPLVVTANWKGEQIPTVVYRSTWGTHAAAIKGGKLRWFNSSTWGFDQMFQDATKRQAADDWLEALLKTQRGHLLAEGTTHAAHLSSDGRCAFVIEDFPCPPLSLSVALGRFKTRIIRYAARVEDADKSNCLMAYDLGPGKCSRSQGKICGNLLFF